jgi:hypothetical protein
MYNPFKPHTVQFENGSFGVRKRDFWTGWLFYSQTGADHWEYIDEYVMKYATASSRDKLRRPLGKGKRIV